MDTTNDEQQIRDLIARWMVASKAGDLAEVLQLMTEDVVFLVPGRPPMRGREAFAAAFTAIGDNVTIDAKSEIQEISVEGRYGYCWSRVSVTVTFSDGGEPKRRAGDVLSVFRKESDGRWRLFRDANLLVSA